jgi:hypothetical protein
MKALLVGKSGFLERISFLVGYVRFECLRYQVIQKQFFS